MTAPALLVRPIEDSYVVPGVLLAAGEYPGSAPGTSDSRLDAKLARFLDSGISAFVDLTDPADGLEPYVPTLRRLAQARDIEVVHERLTIRDMDVCDATHMHHVLDVIDGHLEANRSVYVHCWAGIGRTGMVVGCWLVRHGRSGEDALSEVDTLFRTMSAKKVSWHQSWGSPQTEPQRIMVRRWANSETARATSSSAAGPLQAAAGTPDVLDRYRGALVGLATGDALGTTLEFTTPGAFWPITDMEGGGPFRLKPGQWTDDTSMALCLAESLLECGRFDAGDQMRRYVRWRDEGHWSSNGKCFDIGNATRQALSEYSSTGEPFSGSTSERSAGNGSIMRLAPVPLFFAYDADLAIRMSAESSRTTHGTAMAVDACRYLAGLILGALGGATKEELLVPMYTPVQGLWEREPLHPAVAAVADGSFREKSPPEIKGSGFVVESLEAALWAFATTDNFDSGALAAVNLGDDADTTGAVYGQIAGAYYGESAIRMSWRERIAYGAEIRKMAEDLYRAHDGK